MITQHVHEMEAQVPHPDYVQRPTLRALTLISGLAVTVVGYGTLGAFLAGMPFGTVAALTCGMIGAVFGAMLTAAV